MELPLKHRPGHREGRGAAARDLRAPHSGGETLRSHLCSREPRDTALLILPPPRLPLASPQALGTKHSSSELAPFLLLPLLPPSCPQHQPQPCPSQRPDPPMAEAPAAHTRSSPLAPLRSELPSHRDVPLLQNAARQDKDLETLALVCNRDK